MATMNRVIEYVDKVKPNTFVYEEKYRWMRTLEGRIAREIIGGNTVSVTDNPDADLLAPAPYDEVYALYVMAQIDFLNREYDHYNNTVLAFKELMDAFKAWHIGLRHGKWTEKDGKPCCSVCKSEAETEVLYCPNCSAVMDGKTCFMNFRNVMG